MALEARVVFHSSSGSCFAEIDPVDVTLGSPIRVNITNKLIKLMRAANKAIKPGANGKMEQDGAMVSILITKKRGGLVLPDHLDG